MEALRRFDMDDQHLRPALAMSPISLSDRFFVSGEILNFKYKGGD